MVVASTTILHVSPGQRGELEGQRRKRSLPASVAQRIRIILLLDEGFSYAEIGEQLRIPASTISRWKQRYQKDGLLGLATIHPGQPPSKLIDARILAHFAEAVQPTASREKEAESLVNALIQQDLH